MPELRKDPLLGRWVIIATERGQRPGSYLREPRDLGEDPAGCPFCEGNESLTPPEILALGRASGPRDSRGWRVRVVPNKYPALRVEGTLERKGHGMYDTMSGIGAHEVVIESRAHKVSFTDLDEAEAQDTVLAWRERLADLKRDRRLVYGLVFKNVGSAAGASLEHSHSQIICLPTVPKTPWREIAGAERYLKNRGRCIFCDMIGQELEEEARVVASSQRYLAMVPFASRFPFETWILPRSHASHFEAIDDAASAELSAFLREVLGRLERALENPAYNFVIHSAPFQEGPMPHYHWHVEVLPRLTGVAGFEWGTDFYINPVAPEDAARFLREIGDR